MALIIQDLRGNVFADIDVDVTEPKLSLEPLRGFEFLKLPLEIRSLIWRHLFKVREKPLVVNKRNRNLYIGPLLVCKAFYHEIIGLLFQESNVEIHSDIHFKFMLHELDARARSQIRKLGYLDSHLCNLVNDWTTLFLDCHQLKTLHVSPYNRRYLAEYATLISDSAWLIQYQKPHDGQVPCRLRVTCSSDRHDTEGSSTKSYRNQIVDRVFQSAANRARRRCFELPPALEEFHLTLNLNFYRDALLPQTFDGQWVWGTIEPDRVEPLPKHYMRVTSTCEWMPGPVPTPKTPILLPKNYDNWRLGGP